MIRTVGGLTAKYKRMAEMYKYFGKEWAHVLDFSDHAMIDYFNHESYGAKIDKSKNGFHVGKGWLNVYVAMWIEDRTAGMLPVYELYSDPNLPHWFLDSIFSEFPKFDIEEFNKKYATPNRKTQVQDTPAPIVVKQGRPLHALLLKFKRLCNNLLCRTNRFQKRFHYWNVRKLWF